MACDNHGRGNTRLYTSAKRMFSGVYWNQPVCPSVHVTVFPFVCWSVCPSVRPSVYKILLSVKALAGVLSHI